MTDPIITDADRRAAQAIHDYVEQCHEGEFSIVELESILARIYAPEREWKNAILGLLKTFPEWQTGEWTGDKEGWGFCFEFIKWLHRNLKNEEELESLRATIEKLIARRKGKR